MRAMRVHAWGQPPVAEELDDPRPAPGRSIVRMQAATVGHIDRTVWSGGFLRHPPLPYTPGVEGAGLVVTSEEVDTLQATLARTHGERLESSITAKSARSPATHSVTLVDWEPVT